MLCTSDGIARWSFEKIRVEGRVFGVRFLGLRSDKRCAVCLNSAVSRLTSELTTQWKSTSRFSAIFKLSIESHVTRETFSCKGQRCRHCRTACENTSLLCGISRRYSFVQKITDTDAALSRDDHDNYADLDECLCSSCAHSVTHAHLIYSSFMQQQNVPNSIVFFTYASSRVCVTNWVLMMATKLSNCSWLFYFYQKIQISSSKVITN